MAEAEKGKYSFWVNVNMTKYQIKHLISEVFDVHVVSVKTLTTKKEVKKTQAGKKKIKKPRKKAIVTLKPKEKIDLFEESKK